MARTRRAEVVSPFGVPPTAMRSRGMACRTAGLSGPVISRASTTTRTATAPPPTWAGSTQPSSWKELLAASVDRFRQRLS
jgi:hypothetical protein